MMLLREFLVPVILQIESIGGGRAGGDMVGVRAEPKAGVKQPFRLE